MADETASAKSAIAAATTIGPGAVPEQSAEYEPALNNATRDEVVEIFNPLTVDFIAKVGVTKTTMMPVRIVNSSGNPNFSESDLAARGVSGFRNPDKGGGVLHIANNVPIPAGGTIKQPGDVAQTIVRQLITAVISLSGDKLRISDPETRRQAESRIILSRRPMSELFGGGGPVTIEQQMAQAVEKANAPIDEQGFPEVTMTPEQQRMAHARAAKAAKNA